MPEFSCLTLSPATVAQQSFPKHVMAMGATKPIVLVVLSPPGALFNHSLCTVGSVAGGKGCLSVPGLLFSVNFSCSLSAIVQTLWKS